MIQITNPRRFWIFLVIALLVVLGAAKLVWGSSSMQKSGEITVDNGQPAGSVARELVDQGFMSRILPWRYYTWRLGAAGQIKAGTYRIEKGERVSAVLMRMTRGEVVPDELTITYPEGFTLDQIAERTAARQIGTKEDFLKAAMAANFSSVSRGYLQPLPPGRTLEGYLFPDTYRVFADDTPKDVIERMLLNFERRLAGAGVATDLSGEIQRGRTTDEIIIMASILEREVNRDEDLAIVAGILWKRFDDGVGLDVDATVRYALGNWDELLTVQDLAVDSPYNTRKYRGLPPGPIGNPGLKAIRAALNSQASDYYYYLHAPDGQTIFAKTNDEHNRNKIKYLK